MFKHSIKNASRRELNYPFQDDYVDKTIEVLINYLTTYFAFKKC